jgi:hypothetical protein
MRKFLQVCALFGTLTLAGCPQTDNSDTGNDNSNDNGNNDAASRVIRGRLSASANAKRAGQGADASSAAIVAQAAESMAVYQVTTNADGDFEIEIPEDETSELFMLAMLGPDGRPVGPVVFDQEGSAGFTGLELDGEVDLGTIDLPADRGAGTIAPGDDADLGDSQPAEDVSVRLNEDGAPVGVETFGRGDDAQGEPTDNPRQQCDRDQDGLIDLFDADDDGDGVVDDFDADATMPEPWEHDGLQLNFFMNLKISDEQSQAYFAGDEPGILDSLMNDTVITFEVRGPAADGRNIIAARILSAPGPAYLASAEVLALGGSGGGLWADDAYALLEDGENHFQRFVVPTDLMSTGDTFNVEVTFDDGSTATYARMIRYVFKSIPKVIGTGAPGSVAGFSGGNVSFDGTQDVVIEWNPPVDDFGVLLTGLDYRFEVFYYDIDGQQINEIDGGATWPTPPTGWNAEQRVFEVAGSTLTTPDARNAFSVTLPDDIFVDLVETASGPVAVASYKVDTAAQNGGNNSALMLRFVKQ